jgi:hypothetical protein
MTAITVWLLIAISTEYKNGGNTSFQQLATKEDCLRVAVQISRLAKSDTVRTSCVEVKVPR